MHHQILSMSPVQCLLNMYTSSHPHLPFLVQVTGVAHWEFSEPPSFSPCVLFWSPPVIACKVIFRRSNLIKPPAILPFCHSVLVHFHRMCSWKLVSSKDWRMKAFHSISQMLFKHNWVYIDLNFIPIILWTNACLYNSVWQFRLTPFTVLFSPDFHEERDILQWASGQIPLYIQFLFILRYIFFTSLKCL